MEPIALPDLSLSECRVLGVLVEKAKTTPDAYPLSLNALKTGCNQKSNRDPVLNLDEADVEDTLLTLQKKGLVIHITGAGRVERWRHGLYDAWNVGKVELAILAELLLRGAQSVGELRSRANRMEKIPDLESLNDHLRQLAERKMVVWLSPPGQRGARVTHGFYSQEELDKMRQTPVSSAVATGRIPSPAERQRSDEIASSLEEAKAEIANLKTQMAELQSTVAAMRQELTQLKNELGG